MELLVEQHTTNKEHLLDILHQGSVIGQYSIFNESPLQFAGKAKTNLSILTLRKDDLLKLAEESEHLQEAMEAATGFIMDNDVP